MKIVVCFLSLFFFLLVAQASSNTFLREAKTIHTETKRLRSDSPWIQLADSEEQSVAKLIALLEKSATGKKILQKAQAKAAKDGLQIFDVISAGDGSLTDTTLIRRFSPESPEQIEYETRSHVTVNRRLRVIDAVLDLAHELTHYTFRTPFNPYDHQFNLKSFVKSTVEGEGGEVEAFVVECQVLFELYPHESRQNCQKIIDPITQQLSKNLGVEHFYRVGGHMRSFAQEMGDYALKTEDFPHLSQDDALFISSAWGLPYPVAAFKEYVTIMGRACENDQKRLSIIKNQLSRSPASFESSSRFQKMQSDFEGRCRMFDSQLRSSL